MEHEADTGTTRKLHARQFLVVSLQNRAILVAEFRNDVKDDISAVSEHRVAKLGELGRVLLERGGNSGFDIGQGLLDVHHKDLANGGSAKAPR